MEKFIEYIKYLFLGLVQGVAEIMPISSSGHLMIAQELLRVREPGVVFELFTNMASLLALIIIFYKDIISLIKSFFLYIFKKDERETHKNEFLYAIKIVIAVIPIGIIGLLVKDYVSNLESPLTIGLSLIITSIFLLIIYFIREPREVTTNDENEEIIINSGAAIEHEDVTFKDAIIIGLVQPLAVIPGISRSGSTIVGGRFNRLSLQSILKFSFLCYIVISIPTSLLGLYDLTKGTDSINWTGYIIAFIFSFLGTLITGKLLLKKLKVEHLLYFGIYLLVIAAVAIGLYFHLS